MKLALLEDLYRHKLAELLDAETQLLRALPAMARAASNEDLSALLRKHAAETKDQRDRLERLVAKRAAGLTGKCKGMRGILGECRELLKQRTQDPDVLSLALISLAQLVEGHEITAYACAHNFARLLGFYEDLKPLEQSFYEERKMEDGLMKLAEALGIDQMEADLPLEPVALRSASA